MRDYDESEWLPTKPPRRLDEFEVFMIVLGIAAAWVLGFLFGITAR